MDNSNGYEDFAQIFIKGRGQHVNGVGASTVRSWCRMLPFNSAVLDLGCGTGVPISKVLIEEGMTVYGVDGSPSLIKVFRENFPDVPVVCETVEQSSFFNRKFDAIIAWGLIFLLPKTTQAEVIEKAANALNAGGKFLFTAPAREISWSDAMTGQTSWSLGANKYKELLSEAGLSVIEEFEDEGENHYYYAVKQ